MSDTNNHPLFRTVRRFLEVAKVILSLVLLVLKIVKEWLELLK